MDAVLQFFRTNVSSKLALPFLFIIMWSSGYVAGKIGLPYAGPFTLILIRFSSAALILLAVAFATKAVWPKTLKEYMHLIIVGLLIQALQFGGLYSGLKFGVTAGVSALIVGTMPIFTALGAGWFLKEKVTVRQWGGLGIGLFGVGLVVSNKVGFGDVALGGYFAVVLALIGITAGTLYQKKFCVGMDLRTGGFVQLTVASIVMYFLAKNFEGFDVQWTAPLILSSAWLSIVNSIGAISLLYIMMRKGEASKVASLFYLIPSVTAIMGFLVLGEKLSDIALIGFLVTASGVYITTKK
jgi:drug/metabolite transporter (DMT)-like permease